MSRRETRVARRDFLAAIGRSAGGVAMLRAMAAMGIASTVGACGNSSASAAGAPVPPPSPPAAPPSPRPGDWPAGIGNGRSAVVIGAGIAGLVATLELGRLGYACTLLEASGRAGGRVRTLRAGDAAVETDSVQQCLFDVHENLYFNAGPSRIPHHHEFLLGYCREFGVALETFVNDNRAAWLQRPAQFGGAAQPARRIDADTRGHVAALLSTAIDRNALDAELSATDRARVLAMLRQFGDLDVSNRYAGSQRAGFPGQEATGSRDRGTLLPARDLEDLVADAFWTARRTFTDGLDQQPVMLQPVGGMDRIPDALAAQVIAQLVLNAPVTELRKTADGVRVVYESMGTAMTLEADHGVCCLPATVLSGIANDFSAAHRSEIDGFEYAPAVRIAFQAPRFWEREHNLYGGIAWTDQDITQVWYPSHGFGDDTGILLGAYLFGGAAGEAFTNRAPLQRLDDTLAQAAALHPGLPGLAARGISVAWKKVPWQLGAWGLSAPNTLLSADDRYVFAGEHLSILPAWQEGAILSAYRAIDAIVTRDSQAL